MRAARAALEMRTALDDLNGDLAASWDVRLVTHTGVNTGEIAVSTTPEGEPFTPATPSTSPSASSRRPARGRSSSARSPSGCCAGARALERVEPMRLKGKSDLVAAWRLVALNPGAPGRGAQLARGPGGRARRAAGRVRRGHRDADARDRHADRGRRHRQVAARAGAPQRHLAARGRHDRPLRALRRGRHLPAAGRDRPRAVRARRRGGDHAADGRRRRGPPHRGARRTARRRVAGPVAVEEAHWAVRRLLEVAARDRPLVVWSTTSTGPSRRCSTRWSTSPPCVRGRAAGRLPRPAGAVRAPSGLDERGRRSSVVTLEPLDDTAAASCCRARRRQLGAAATAAHRSRRPREPALPRADGRDARRARGAVGGPPADDPGAARRPHRRPPSPRAGGARARGDRGRGPSTRARSRGCCRPTPPTASRSGWPRSRSGS